jgi:hypothetical protein
MPTIQERIKILEKHFGKSFMDSILKSKNGLDIADINVICNRTIIAQSVSSISGFNKIKDQIVSNPKPSLNEPHGQWFQLEVGYILKSIGEFPIFEKKIDNNPKDILIRDEKIHIECKSFWGGKAWEKAANEYLKSGEIPKIKSDSPKGFAVKMTTMSTVDNLIGRPFIPPIIINEFHRFLSNGVKEKYNQLLDGFCNLIAFNCTEFTSDIHRIQEPILDLLRSAEYPRISGFLVIQNEGISQYDLLGLPYTVDLIESPFAAVKVPHDLPQALRRQIKIALKA